MNPEELIRLYNNIQAKDPTIIGQSLDEFLPTVSTRADLDIFLGGIEQYHPDVFEKYQSNKTQGAPSLIQEDPLQSQMRQKLAPPKTVKQQRSELLNAVYPVDTSIAIQEKQRKQSVIDQRREEEEELSTYQLLSGNLAGGISKVKAWFDNSAEEDKNSAEATLIADKSISIADYTPDLVVNFTDSKAAEQNRRNAELFKSNRELLEQGKGLSTDIWTNLPAKRIHELQEVDGMTLDQIMAAPEIEGYTSEQLLQMKELIGAEQVKNAKTEYEKLDAFDRVLAGKEELIPQYIKDGIARLNEILPLGDQMTPAQRQEAINIRDTLVADPAYKEYQEISERFDYSQQARNEIKTKYPQVDVIKNLNEDIQAKRNEKYSNTSTFLRSVAFIMGAPVIEALPRLVQGVGSTIDAEMAAGGSEAAELRLALRAQDLKRDGAWRDAQVATRTIFERVANFDADGKIYSMAFSDEGRALEIYDETGNPAQLSDKDKLDWLQWGEQGPLKVTAKTKFNSSAAGNAVNDAMSDMIGTIAMTWATSGLGSGQVLSRVRQGMAVLGQYEGQFVEEGIAEGLGVEDAVNRGRLLAGIEAGTEMMFNVFGKVTDPIQIKGTKDAVKRVLAEGSPTEIKRIANREFRKALLDIPGEGFEEVTSAALSPFVNALYNDMAGTDFDQELPSGLDIIEAGGLGMIVSAVPSLIGAARSRAGVRKDQYYKESVYALVKDPNKTQQAIDFVGQGTELLPVIQATANKARVDLADKSLTEQQKIDRVAAIFNSEIAKQRQTELSGTPRAGEADGLVDATDKELEAAYAQQDVVDAISSAVVQNTPQESTDSTVTGEDVNQAQLEGIEKRRNSELETLDLLHKSDIHESSILVDPDTPLDATTPMWKVNVSRFSKAVGDSGGMLYSEALSQGGFTTKEEAEEYQKEVENKLGVRDKINSKYDEEAGALKSTPRPITATPKTVQGYADIIKATIPQLTPEQVQGHAVIAQTQVNALVRESGIPEEEAWARVKGKITTDFNRMQGEVLRQPTISISQQYNEGEIDENELLQNIRSREVPVEVKELAPVLEQALSRGDNMSAAAIGQEISDILAANETSAPTSVFPTPELHQQFKTEINDTIRAQQIRTGGRREGSQEDARRLETSEILGRSHQTARSLGLTNPREIEEIALREWAIANGLWVEDIDADLRDRFFRNGLESKVYLAEDGVNVIKGNDGKAYASWAAALFSFEQTNVYFPSAPLTLLGFGNVTDVSGKKVFGAILGQPLVENPKSPTQQQIIADMKKRGFRPLSADSFVHKETGLEVDDLHTRNVLIDEDGTLRYIDVNIHDPNSPLFTDGYLPLETAVQENETFTLREQEETVNIELPNGRQVTGITNPEVVNGFYSPLEKIINESKQGKMPVKQWIEKYANSDEAKWTGLRDWLGERAELAKIKWNVKPLRNGSFRVTDVDEKSAMGIFDFATEKEADDFQNGRVSKSDILKFLRDNRIQVVEVVKGEGQKEVLPLSKVKWETPDPNSDLYEDFAYVSDDGKYRVAKYSDGSMVLFNDEDVSIARINSITEDIEIDKDDADTKFSQHQLEGAKSDYKEVLILFPGTSTKQREDFEFFPRTGKEVLFRSTHFDEPNILVHLRMNTRTDIDGNKVLFLEEVQSDWGQKGRKEGFRSKEREEADRLEKVYEEAQKKVNKYWTGAASDESWESVAQLAEADPVFKELLNKEQSAFDDFRASIKGSESTRVPNAPFVTDTNAWTKLGLKVALKEAVAQGADKIAWTTGEQQNERYDLSKQVDYITKHEENSVNKEDNSVDVTISVNNGLMGVVVDKVTGKIKSQNGSSQFGDFKGKGLDEVIGKDITDKILKLDNTEHKLQGDGLKVGGKGMVGFYGSPTSRELGIVGKVAKNLFKQEPKATIITLSRKDDAIDPFTDFINNMKEKYGEMGWVKKLTKEEKEEYQRVAEYEQPLKTSTQHSIDITPKLKAEVEEGLPLFQKDTEGNTRGAATRTGTYFSNQADVSTPIHEDHHHFLDIIDELAAEGNEWALEQKAAVDEFAASEEGKKFWARKKASGVEWARGRFNRNNYTYRQELFAESAEKYFSEGEKAGFSDTINKVFERFKVWLQDLYKNLLDSPLVIELSPKMRGLFDSIYGPAKVTKDISQHNRKADSNTGVNDYVWAPVMVDNGTGVPPAPQAPDRATVLKRLREKKAAGEYTNAETVFNDNPEAYESLDLKLQEDLGAVLNEGREMMPLANGMTVPDVQADDTEMEKQLLNEFIAFEYVTKETMSKSALSREAALPDELYSRPEADYNETANKLLELVTKVFRELGTIRANDFFLRNIRGRKIPLDTETMLITHLVNRPGIMNPNFRVLVKIIETEINRRAGIALGVIGWARKTFGGRRGLGGDDTLTAGDKKLARRMLSFEDNQKLEEAEAAMSMEASIDIDATDDVLLEMDSPTPLKIIIDSDIVDTGNIEMNKVISDNAKEILQTALKKKYGDDYIAAMVNIINETGRKC